MTPPNRRRHSRTAIAGWASACKNVHGGGSLYSRLSFFTNTLGVGPTLTNIVVGMLDRIDVGRPIQRLHAWLMEARKTSKIGFPPGGWPGAGTRRLLPMHLPQVLHVGQRHASALRSSRRSAVAIAEWLISAYNYFEVGCPKTRGQYITALGPYGVSAEQRVAFESLVRQVEPFCRVAAIEGWSRGRKTLFEAIKLLESSGRAGSRCDPMTVPAQAVNPDRVSLPARAATCRPEDHLLGGRAEELERVGVPLLKKAEWPPRLPETCHWIGPEDERRLRVHLWEIGMVEFRLEHELLHVDGAPVTAGLFCVPHKAQSDRLIVDRRKANAIEARLNWSWLPNGAQLGQLQLNADEDVRGCGEDLSNYFYLLENPPDIRGRAAIGRGFYGSEVPDAGLDQDALYYACLRVWGMGDHNAVCVAQSVHEDVLTTAGAWNRDTAMRYGVPLGPGPFYQGIYIDDLLLLQKTPKHKVGDPAAGEDSVVLGKARAGYAKAGLPTATGKSFEYSRKFVAWGVEVDSASGLASVPAGRRLQLFVLTMGILSLGRCSPEILRSLLGCYVHPFGLRRELSCCFGRAYRWLEGLRPRRSSSIPADVFEELRLAALHLPLAASDLRAPVSTTIHTSDATPSRGAFTTATVSRDLASALFDHAEHRGRYTRLDWHQLEGLGVPPPLELWEDRELPEVLRQCVLSAHWVAEKSFAYRTLDHVNLQEARAVKGVLRQRAAESIEAERIAVGVDSRVILGAFAKGRSSSGRLNQILRECLGWSVLSRKRLVEFWLRSADNISDDPSREVDLRPRPAADPVVERLVRPEASRLREVARGPGDAKFLGLEVFGGAGGLTRALRQHGLQMAHPIDSGGGKDYRVEQDLLQLRDFEDLKSLIEADCFWYVHFGLPCSSWSALRRMSGGTRRLDKPEGSLELESEIEANLLGCRVLELCWLLKERGRFFSIENPASSYFWHFEPTRDLLRSCLEVTFDQCE